MMFCFHPHARDEFEEAVRYYEECQPGLGLEFAAEVYETIKRIADYPNAWAPMTRNTRRCLVSRFPYRVIYQAKNDTLLIVAVANLHREPNYWRGRSNGR